jgi:hypothetical protein
LKIELDLITISQILLIFIIEIYWFVIDNFLILI